MRRIISASVAVLFLGLTPVTGFAAPGMQKPVASSNPAITQVDGWWEQEHHDQDARERYQRLPPKQYQRYNRLQAEQMRREQQRREIDAANQRSLREQHSLLGFEFTIH